MTKDRMLLHRNLGEGHQKKYILQALKECLDEIERLQKEIDDIRDEAQQMAGEIDLNT